MIVFDLDGTLVDSAPEILAAMEGAWNAIESGPFPREKFRIGPPLAELVREVGARQPAALAAEFRARYDASDFSATRPFPGIPEVLARLRPVALATNKRNAPTQKIVARWFAGAFERVACADALDGAAGTYDKTAMLRVLGATVLVGDTTGDIEAARAAGARVVAVAWGYDAVELLERAQPDVIVREPAALFEAVSALRPPA